MPLATFCVPSKGDNLSRSRTGQPPQQHRRFVRITHIRCPDCDIEGRLTTDGRPRVISGGQLRGASRYVGLTTAPVTCDTCKGKGYFEVDPLSPESIDPYARKS